MSHVMYKRFPVDENTEGKYACCSGNPNNSFLKDHEFYAHHVCCVFPYAFIFFY